MEKQRYYNVTEASQLVLESSSESDSDADVEHDPSSFEDNELNQITRLIMTMGVTVLAMKMMIVIASISPASQASTG